MNFIQQQLQKKLDALLSTELSVEVEQDETDLNPRIDYDNAGIVCVKESCKYLSNECVGFDFDSHTSLDEVQEWLRKEKGAILILPLYVYDHSGVTINTTGFNTGYGNWDGGQIGYYYATEQSYRAQIGDNWDADNVNKVLLQEIWLLDKYLSGNIYAYLIKNKLGTVIDSCGNFLDYDEAMDSGNAELKGLQETYNKEVQALKLDMARIQELPLGAI